MIRRNFIAAIAAIAVCPIALAKSVANTTSTITVGKPTKGDNAVIWRVVDLENGEYQDDKIIVSLDQPYSWETAHGAKIKCSCRVNYKNDINNKYATMVPLWVDNELNNDFINTVKKEKRPYTIWLIKYKEYSNWFAVIGDLSLC